MWVVHRQANNQNETSNQEFDTETSTFTNITSVLSFAPFGGVSVTSVDLISRNESDSELVAALGCESGLISVWILETADLVTFTARALYVIPDMFCHGVGMSVRRIRWSPVSSNVFASENHVIKLASCSDDHSNRVFSFYNIFNALTV